jgi:hypothetical protein
MGWREEVEGGKSFKDAVSLVWRSQVVQGVP